MKDKKTPLALLFAASCVDAGLSTAPGNPNPSNPATETFAVNVLGAAVRPLTDLPVGTGDPSGHPTPRDIMRP